MPGAAAPTSPPVLLNYGVLKQTQIIEIFLKEKEVRVQISNRNICVSFFGCKHVPQILLHYCLSGYGLAAQASVCSRTIKFLLQYLPELVSEQIRGVKLAIQCSAKRML